MTHVNLAIVIQIAGIRSVLYGADGTYTPGGEYVGINCIDLESLGSLREVMPKFGGVAKPSGLSFDLVDRGGAISDLFSRSVEEETFKDTLETTLQAEPETDFVYVDGDLSAWPTSGYIHVGQEAIKYTGTDTELEPHAFTGVSRGALGSQIAEHLVDSAPFRSWKPWVTKNPTFFRGRACTVRVHDVAANGVVSTSGVEILRGFLSAEPEQVGAVWRLTAVQDLGRFDVELGDARLATVLVEGYHYFDGETCRDLFIGETADVGSIWSSTARQGLEGVDQLSTDDGWTHERIWGTVRGNYNGNPANALLNCEATEEYEVPVTGYVNDGAGNRAFTLAREVDTYGGSVWANEFEVRNVTIPVAHDPGLQVWPEAVVNAFNDKANVTLTANGAFWYLDCSLSGNGESVLIQCDFPYNRERGPALTIYKDIPADPSLLWYPILNVPDDLIQARGFELEYARQGFRQRKISIRARNSGLDEDRGAVAQLSPVPSAFYQAGEKYLLVKDNLFPSLQPGSVASVRATWGEGLETVLEITAVDAVTDENGASVGYRLTVSERSRNSPDTLSFGTYGDTAPRLTPFVEFRGEDPRRLLLKLMLSGFSSSPGFPHADYSVLSPAYGLRIPPASVDIAGILRYPIPPVLSRLTFRPIKPVQARELIDPILQALGAALVTVNVGGTLKISLVRARAGAPMLAQEAILNGDWIPEDRPVTSKLDEIYSTYRIKSNYSATEDKFLVEANFEDADSFDAYGQQNAIEIPIRGLQLVPEGVAAEGVYAHSALISVYKNLRALGGYATRVFQGSVRWSTAVNFTIGRTILASIAEARIGDTRGIVSKPMLIRSREFDPVNRVVKLELLYRGRAVSSFAPCMRVTEVLSGNKVQLADNAYSDPVHPVTGEPQKDWTFYTANGVVPAGGISVELVHVGSEEDNTVGTLTAVTAGGVATIAAHGLSVGDRIRPRVWDNAASIHRIYAFISADGVLGVSNDPGFVYS